MASMKRLAASSKATGIRVDKNRSLASMYRDTAATPSIVLSRPPAMMPVRI
jgi:hypothetical protein